MRGKNWDLHEMEGFHKIIYHLKSLHSVREKNVQENVQAFRQYVDEIGTTQPLKWTVKCIFNEIGVRFYMRTYTGSFQE